MANQVFICVACKNKVMTNSYTAYCDTCRHLYFADEVNYEDD